VKNVKRPLCVMASQNDSRTPLKPVIRHVTELASHPGTFGLHALPNKSHMVGTAKDLVDRRLPEIAFLHKKFAPDVA
jgi:dipeptidyl aminopeptidase/acylaminoacyl peptidase